MHEPWFLINIDKREYSVTHSIHSTRWDEPIFARTPLIHWLTQPSPRPAQGVAAPSPESLAAMYTPEQGKRAGILHLPSALVQRLARACDYSTDAVCLAVACRHVAGFADAALSAFVARWAGDRIVRVRVDVPALDLVLKTAQTRWPADMFTEAERRELVAYCTDCHHVPRLCEFFESRYTELESTSSALFKPLLPGHIARSGSEAAKADAEYFEAWVQGWQIRTMTDPDDDRLALRNLSKRQFLRARDLRRLREKVGLNRHPGALRLEHVVMKRAYWCAEHSRGSGAVGSLERRSTVAAPWAGDKFEIAEMDEEDGWVDVYEEVRLEYWEGNHGAQREMMAEDYE